MAHRMRFTRVPAAKWRKNAAQGASAGCRQETSKPKRDERNCGHSSLACGFNYYVPVTKGSPTLTILHAAPLKKFPWLMHGVSTRLGGYSQAYGRDALNLGFTK